MGLVFIDFEASSLERGSFPIELGWVTEDGTGTSVLIRPEPGWREWSPQSQAIHGISRADLARDGIPAAEAALLASDAFDGNTVLADRPAWDGAWLNMLLAAAGRPSRKVEDLDGALIKACFPLLSLLPPPGEPGRAEMEERVRELATQAMAGAHVAAEQAVRTRHRALPDARANWAVWKDVGERATILAASVRPAGPR